MVLARSQCSIQLSEVCTQPAKTLEYGGADGHVRANRHDLGVHSEREAFSAVAVIVDRKNAVQGGRQPRWRIGFPVRQNPSRHEVAPGVQERLDKAFDPFGGGLDVVIGESDDLATRMGQPRIHRGRLPGRAHEHVPGTRRVRRRELRHDVRRGISRAVIGDDDLEPVGGPRLTRHGAKRALEESTSVPCGNYDRDNRVNHSAELSG